MKFAISHKWLRNGNKLKTGNHQMDFILWPFIACQASNIHVQYLLFFRFYMFLTRIETGKATKTNVFVNDFSSLFHENNVSANNKKTKGLSEPPVISRYHRNQKWTFHLRWTTNLPPKSKQKTNSWGSFREPQDAPRTFPRPSQDPSISRGPPEHLWAPPGPPRDPPCTKK